MRAFARFACIDWSGAAGERQKGIAIAACPTGDAAPQLVGTPGRWSRVDVRDWLLALADEGADMLIGMDFSGSFPFADAGAFFPGWASSPADARALWALVDTIASAEPHLAANSFVDHADAAPHFRRHGGREGHAFGGGTGRMRIVESRTAATPASCFNLVGAKQVGKASLTGMRLLRQLDGRIPVWPFDPVPASGPVLVEIYTGIAAMAAGLPRNRTKVRDTATLARALAALDSATPPPLARCDDHSTDAIITAAWLRRAAARPELWQPAPPFSPTLAAKEGWTFGVP
ncbi:hypothetical protein SAMN06295912_10615 [Sphingomonas laterariae]|uniref:DUF429 domain-containing protein n=1 Tax=Edaphosphingomonas laterariae TaxID=861865 RepID=A0A239EAB6_9SPHN|nr:hypothetical protein [Sphingomonas laterariae]SNS40963.1 hypothetical protein SAMN06295912_10615 [Sphingomonas laterariae]